jgi:hypothetical protein
MTGPRPAGKAWTPEDDRQLIAMVQAGVDKQLIARKLKRTVAAVQSRRGKLRKLARPVASK